MPGGRAVVFGTKDTQFADPIAHLYLLHPRRPQADGPRRRADSAPTARCSRADGGGLILYDIDTPTDGGPRYRLDVAARTAEDRGVALDLRAGTGFPDGMCDCGDGTVIVAFYNPDPVPAGRAGRFDSAPASWSRSGRRPARRG